MDKDIFQSIICTITYEDVLFDNQVNDWKIMKNDEIRMCYQWNNKCQFHSN